MPFNMQQHFHNALMWSLSEEAACLFISEELHLQITMARTWHLHKGKRGESGVCIIVLHLQNQAGLIAFGVCSEIR